MPGNDQSVDIDAYLRYIFGEENEPEQVGTKSFIGRYRYHGPSATISARQSLGA